MAFEPRKVVAVTSSQFRLVASPQEPSLEVVRSPNYIILLPGSQKSNADLDSCSLLRGGGIWGELSSFLQLPIRGAMEPVMKGVMTVGATAENCFFMQSQTNFFTCQMVKLPTVCCIC